MTLAARIAEGIAAMHLDVPPQTAERLAAYIDLIAKWNRVHNLTAVREPERMVVLHLLDSLSILPDIGAAARVVDVGSGAGLPGIPIAISRPDVRVALLDSAHKKCAFLRQAKIDLALDNAEVVCERVGEWRPQDRFDVIVSRAFSDLADFVSQAQHLLAPGGRLIAMKGVYPFEELARVPPSHRVAEVRELRVPSLDAKRHVVVVEAA
jgi:16S rRNA (guanine527-N7)-methyltransferase